MNGMSFSNKADPRQYDTKGELKRALEIGDAREVMSVIKRVEDKVRAADRKLDRSEMFRRTLEEVASAFLEVIYEEIRDELRKD